MTSYGWISYPYPFAQGGSVSEIYISNFDVISKVSSADGLSGWVDFGGTGSGALIKGGSDRGVNATQPAGRNSFNFNDPAGRTHWDTDPDLLYAGAVQVIPEPGSMALVSLAFLGLVAVRRRR